MPRLTRSIGSNSDIVNNKRLWLTKLLGSYNSRTEIDRELLLHRRLSREGKDKTLTQD